MQPLTGVSSFETRQRSVSLSSRHADLAERVLRLRLPAGSAPMRGSRPVDDGQLL